MMRWRSGTLDDLYFEWLYEQVDVILPSRRQTYWNLARELYCREFLYFVPNDDNRAIDGLELRDFFLETEEIEPDPYWERLPCSVLEMLVALARRVEFKGGGSVRKNFWHFLNNMGIGLLHDEVPPTYLRAEVEHAVHTLNYRQYSYSGHNGGLFPLDHPEEDQRGVELWYQMAAYLREEVLWTSTMS